jgi:hypothetical protein
MMNPKMRNSFSILRITGKVKETTGAFFVKKIKNVSKRITKEKEICRLYDDRGSKIPKTGKNVLRTSPKRRSKIMLIPI